MRIEETGYLKEIPDVEWVQEVIMERFDSALELLGVDSIVYGGAVRDCLAGLELLGDLDIATTRNGLAAMVDRFHKSTKWVAHDSSVVEQKTFQTMPAKAGKWTSPKMPSRNSGDMARELSPMSNVTAFRTLGDKVVQLITSKRLTRDKFQDAVYMTRTVDITCCGVLLAADGRVFEAVPGAYQDCLDRVLRLNEDSNTIFVDALPFRVEKLVARGWKNEIDVNKAIRDVKLAQEREKKRIERQRASMARREAQSASHKSSFDSEVMNYFVNGSGKNRKGGTPTGFTNEIPFEEVSKYHNGDIKRVVGILKQLALQFQVDMRIKTSPMGRIYYTMDDTAIADRISHEMWQINRVGREMWSKKRAARGKATVEKKRFLTTLDSPVIGHMEAPLMEAPPMAEPLPVGPSGSSSPQKVPRSVKRKGPAMESRVTIDGNIEIVFRNVDTSDGTVDVRMIMTEEESRSLRTSWARLGGHDRIEILNTILERAGHEAAEEADN